MEVPQKKRRSGPSGRHRTPRQPSPRIPDNPLEALVKGALQRNDQRLSGPRSIPDLVRATGLTLARIGMALQGRRRLSPEAAGAIAAALELDEAAVTAAGEATWAMRPEDAGHG